MKLLQVGSLTFFWYSGEGPKPHVHVRRGSGENVIEVKIWLDTLKTASETKRKFNASTIKRIRRILQEHQAAWTQIYLESR